MLLEGGFHHSVVLHTELRTGPSLRSTHVGFRTLLTKRNERLGETWRPTVLSHRVECMALSA